MNEYVEMSKKFVCSILNNYAEPTTDGLCHVLEIKNGNIELLLEHLKAITKIMNKAIVELEDRGSEDLLKLYVELQEDNETLLSRIRGFKSQQKEFIKYLEDEISKWHNNYDSYNYECEIEEPTAEELANKILQKYKKIIGDDK